MRRIIFAAVSGAFALSLAACGGAGKEASLAESIVRECWAARVQQAKGLGGLEIGELKVDTHELTEADKKNGFTWGGSVDVDFTYKQTPSSQWDSSVRSFRADAREGKVTVHVGLDGVQCPPRDL